MLSQLTSRDWSAGVRMNWVILAASPRRELHLMISIHHRSDRRVAMTLCSEALSRTHFGMWRVILVY
jgi:hypothetical protein